MGTLDLTGKKFGLLRVEAVERAYSGKPFWQCRCRCGGLRVCQTNDLRAGRAKACYECAAKMRLARMRRQAKARGFKTSDVAKLTAMLDERGRRLYDRWESNCERLSVRVSRNERVEVLRELVNGRAQ